MNRTLFYEQPPQRVVSLVPSMTESLFELGLGSAVVGITDYCIYPSDEVAGVRRLGGPKNPSIEDIINLHPDLVIANMEENSRQTVEELEATGLAVWVSFPQSVFESMEVLWKLVELFRSVPARMRLQTLEVTLDWAISAAEGHPRSRYFCPIWFEETSLSKPWWMTFNQATYCHDLLKICGGENTFINRQRRYPLEADLGMFPPQEPAGRDVRYPRITLDEIIAARPEVILLPSEPFGFGEIHCQRFKQMLYHTPAVQNDRLYLVDGTLISWHGTRLARSLQELPRFFFI